MILSEIDKLLVSIPDNQLELSENDSKIALYYTKIVDIATIASSAYSKAAAGFNMNSNTNDDMSKVGGRRRTRRHSRCY